LPKVSIVIPVYNVENYLKECLNSLINQTFKDIEIICVNDGSTDNSLNILNEYSQNDNRIKVFNQSNSGAAISRNNGIKEANGEYLAILDADDIYYSTMERDHASNFYYFSRAYFDCLIDL
jgi:glycosyltransferase involved in cell wall biosynthesis